MKRHLFLTGEKGVGKSTILRLLAASWEGPVGGFRTPCRPAGEGKVVGALRQEENPFLAAVRAHPQVEVILVTRENRDRLPGRLAKRLYPIGEESAGEVYKEGKLW